MGVCGGKPNIISCIETPSNRSPTYRPENEPVKRSPDLTKAQSELLHSLGNSLKAHAQARREALKVTRLDLSSSTIYKRRRNSGDMVEAS
mmetsp:Transcript_9988/g.19760  ORF Transcript_9988/g.19760 Transcript_9988/m.19760 type:complete len:90 (+) Transcript_9988:97-366(+)